MSALPRAIAPMPLEGEAATLVSNGLHFLLGLVARDTGLYLPTLHVSNEVWGTHPDCRCERADCAWCLDCQCPPAAEEYWVGPRQVAYEEFSAALADPARSGLAKVVHRPDLSCLNCHTLDLTPSRRGAPQLWHNPSGALLWWYKSPGRELFTNDAALVPGALLDCLSRREVSPGGEPPAALYLAASSAP